MHTYIHTYTWPERWKSCGSYIAPYRERERLAKIKTVAENIGLFLIVSCLADSSTLKTEAYVPPERRTVSKLHINTTKQAVFFTLLETEVEIEVTLRLTDSQSACLGIEHPCGTCDQILLPVGVLLSEI
jgi:hypothetical protein